MGELLGEGTGLVRCRLTDRTVVCVAADVESVTGHANADLVSGHVKLRDLFHPDDADIADRIFSPSPEGTAGPVNFRLRHRSGRFVCVRGTAARRRHDTEGVELELQLESAVALRSHVDDRTTLTNFVAMMETTDDYIYFKDRNHVFTGASQTLVSVTDPSERWTDLLGKTDYDVFPEAYADRYYALEKQIFSGAVTVAREVQPTLDNAGRRGWVDNRKYPIQNAAGDIVGLFGIARDITDQKLAEESRVEALERLQKVAAMVPGLVFQLRLEPDGTSHIPYVSDAVRELYGVSPDEVRADVSRLYQAIEPDDLPALLDSVMISARDLTPWAVEHRVRLATGATRYMFGKAVPQKEPDGSVLWHGFVGDITEAAERRRAEADLRIAATAFESRDGMVVTDADGTILKVNRAFSDITGYSAEEAVGRTPALLNSGRHGPDFYRAMWTSIVQTGRWEGEIWNRRKGGEVYPEWLTITAVKTAGGQSTHYVGAFSDITERRRLESWLHHSQKLEAIGQLAGSVAHDFNNLLAVILAYTTLAVDALHTADPIRDDLLEVQRAADQAKTLTQQLLAFGRRQVLEPRTVDLNRVVLTSRGMLARLLGEGIEVATELADDLDPIRVDPSQMQQVIMNLSINARDAMPNGGTLTIRTARVDHGPVDPQQPGRAVAPGPHVELSISDNGLGMDATTVGRIFEPFFTTKDQGKGTGLGLSMVYGIVAQSGGVITVSSEVGRGTTFTISLPASSADAATESVAPEPEPGATAPGETVMVVDDADAVRRLTERILTKAGYVVLAASNGEEALALLESHPGEVHLLLTDVVMPRMSGAVLARRLSTLRPATRVLFMSGHASDNLGTHGVLGEGTHFLAKPFTAARLTRRVRDVLDLPAPSRAPGGPSQT